MNPSLPEWVPDDSVGHCQRCIVPFTLTNRKHHCRACGRVVCHGCSPHRIALQPNIPDEKVRVCEDCKDEREQAEAAAAEVSANIEAKVSELEPPSSSAATSTIAKPLLNVASPVPVATSPISSPQAPASLATVAGVASKPVPVAATAPRVVLPTAAVVTSGPASTSGSGSGGFFSGLSKKLEKHAPGLVAAVKEHVAAATTKHEEQRLEKHAHAERIIAQADASTAAANSGAALSPLPSSSTVLSPAVSPSVPVKSAPISSVSSGGSGGNIAHIPGLGTIALAPSPLNEEDKEDSAWSQLARQPAAANVDPEVELPADAELRRRHHPKGDTVDGRRKSLTDQSISLTESASSTTEGLSSSSSSSSSLKLDLPLRLCLVILKKTAHEMREKYSEYLLTKQRRAEGDEPLSFHQFMFFSTIRTLPEFLFKKTELAFCMMREEGDTLVFRDNFVRYAPILAPLASRLDADKLYLCLEHASIQSGAALTLEQVQQQEEEDEYQAIEAHTHGNAKLPIPPPTPRIRRKVGGVAYAPFKIYVDALKKHSHPDTCQWPDFKHFGAEFGMDRHEQLLCVRTGVADTTHFPPRIGRLGLTTNFLLYEPSFLKGKRGIRWSSITRIETNEEGFWKKTVASATGAGSAISPASASTAASTHSPTHDKNATSGETKGFKVYVLSDDHTTDDSQSLTHTGIPQPKEHCIALDIPGWSIETVFQRQRTYEYMRILVHLHRLVASIPDKVVSSALVQETTQTIVRMRSLESVGNGCNPLLLNPFPGYVMDVNSHQQKKHAKRKSVVGGVGVGGDDLSPDSTSFVSSISASISRSEAIRKSKSSWLFAVLPGLQNKEQESLEEDIDPEVAAQNYKTAEELLKLQQQHEQPFSLKNFAYNVKLFRYEIEPLMLFIALIKRVRDWENPIVTLMTVLILLNMAYRDLLQYLPALLILINIGIVATLRYYPNAVWVALGGPQSEAAAAAAAAGSSNTAPSTTTIVELDESKEENELTLTDTEGNTVSAMPASSSKTVIPTAQPVAQPKKESDREGLFAKLKNYRDVAVKTKDYLHSVQNSVAEQNVRFMQVEGLYKWRSPLVTQKFFIMLCAGFLVMVFIPFRFIFPLIVIDFFTTKWQRSGSLERLLNEVPLPARMPEID